MIFEKLRKKAVDFSALPCYTPFQESTKEAAEVMNCKFYFSYFIKGCPSYVMTKA